jgi:polyferredoxin
MDKMGYPRGLIRFSTENALRQRWNFAQMLRRAFRPRVLVYGAVLGAMALGSALSMALRVPLKVDVIRDRGSLSREVEGGMIENVYRLQIMNTEEASHRFRIAAGGLPSIEVVGEDAVEIGGASTRLLPLRLRVDGDAVGRGSHRIEIRVSALDAPGIAARERSTFVVR